MLGFSHFHTTTFLFKRRIFFALICPVVVLVNSCAKIGTPSGGPKDTTPPKVVSTKPPEYATNVVPGKKIEITFDEFIQLKDINQELIISPPLNDRLISQLKNKTLIVQFPKDAVFDTTTYTISFGNSIVDNNEGNVLKNYEFVFSLKSYIDSMSIEGRVVNAFDHTPDKKRMNVMLYKDLSDSAPLKEKPRYIAWTDENGNFSLHNLETGTYRIFALKDANYNMIYDQANEEIAFADSAIKLYPGKIQPDTLAEDSLLFAGIAPTDTTKIDSLKKVEERNRNTYYIEMGFFVQKKKNQYMTNNERPLPEELQFTFNEPLQDSFCIRPLNINAPRNWYLFDGSKDDDSLTYWLTDTSMINMDSLEMEVTYPIWDTTGELISHMDTLWMVNRVSKGQGNRRLRRGRRATEEQVDSTKTKKLQFTNSIKNAAAYDLNKPVVITTVTPLSNFKPDRIQLFQLQDTLEIPQKIEVTRDSSSLYRLVIRYTPEELSSYKLLIPDSTITDIYGATNDTSIVKFKTQSEDHYGILTMNITNVKEQLILQLLDEKEKVVRQNILQHDEKVRYEYLEPKKYLLKIIVDSNKNGKWDTGNYLKHRQPERVIYYKNEINVRSNWEIEQNWEIK